VCAVSSASLGPTYLSPSESRLVGSHRRPRHPGRGPVPVDLLLDRAISTGTSSALRRLGPAVRPLPTPRSSRCLIIVTLLQDQPHSFTSNLTPVQDPDSSSRPSFVPLFASLLTPYCHLYQRQLIPNSDSNPLPRV